jgi:hypothetical protein
MGDQRLVAHEMGSYKSTRDASNAAVAGAHLMGDQALRFRPGPTLLL